MLTRRTGDRERAEDLAQDVFAKALESPPRNPKPWLFAVALNLARDDGRKAVRQQRHLALLTNESDGAHVPPPDEEVQRNEQRARVQEALDELVEQDRAVLLMKAEGLSYDEIAEATGLSKGSIGTTLARARKRLVESYRERDKGEGIGDVAR